MASSVMKHDFSRVPVADIPRSAFDRSHGVKTTFNGGYLVPVFVDEALPGDTLNLKMTGFGRLSTPLHPFMDNLFIDSFFFAVPVRLLWSNWQKFNGEQDNPGDSTDFWFRSWSPIRRRVVRCRTISVFLPVFLFRLRRCGIVPTT